MRIELRLDIHSIGAHGSSSQARVDGSDARAHKQVIGDDRVANLQTLSAEPSREDFNDINLNPGQDTREILMT